MAKFLFAAVIVAGAFTLLGTFGQGIGDRLHAAAVAVERR
jgi:hypothetical protein